MKEIKYLILILVTIFCLVGCDNTQMPNNEEDGGIIDSNLEEDNTENNNEQVKGEIDLKPRDRYNEVEQNPIVTMEMENGSIVKMELFPKIAPESVENFISLINSGYYDGLTFHRTIPGFMAQGGDKKGDGTGSLDYSIYGEFPNNGVDNTISHVRGTVSMARKGNYLFPETAYNTAGSQFFIVTDDSTFLDPDYAAFGKVIEGMEIVDEIVNVEVITRDETKMEANRPVNPPVIKTITVETFGVEYAEPTKIVN